VDGGSNTGGGGAAGCAAGVIAGADIGISGGESDGAVAGGKRIGDIGGSSDLFCQWDRLNVAAKPAMARAGTMNRAAVTGPFGKCDMPKG
jgi:hypothetical protein